MIDSDGYRPNVGIVICNKQGQVLWAKRFGQNSWQFPQGGVNEGENIETAMYRELFEEVGLTKKDVRLIWASKYWLKYKLPRRLVRENTNASQPTCIGQKQRWFLLELIGGEANINLKTTKNPEFDGWRWVSFWYPVRQVVSFKRDVYRKVMKEFASILLNEQAIKHRFEREERYIEQTSTAPLISEKKEEKTSPPVTTEKKPPFKFAWKKRKGAKKGYRR